MIGLVNRACWIWNYISHNLRTQISADVSINSEFWIQTNHLIQTKLLLTVCSYHVTYAFQNESTLYSCLNVNELLARSRREISSLSDCNWTGTQNNLVRKRTLVNWPAWPNGWVFFYELSGSGFESSCSHLKLLFVG